MRGTRAKMMHRISLAILCLWAFSYTGLGWAQTQGEPVIYVAALEGQVERSDAKAVNDRITEVTHLAAGQAYTVHPKRCPKRCHTN